MDYSESWAGDEEKSGNGVGELDKSISPKVFPPKFKSKDNLDTRSRRY